MGTIRINRAAAAGPLGHLSAVSCAIRCAAIAQGPRRLLAVAERFPLRSAREYLLFFLRCAGLYAAHESRAPSEGSATEINARDGCLSAAAPHLGRLVRAVIARPACEMSHATTPKTFREGVVQPTETTPPGRLRRPERAASPVVR
jgi:hypothetical protein